MANFRIIFTDEYGQKRDVTKLITHLDLRGKSLPQTLVCFLEKQLERNSINASVANAALFKTSLRMPCKIPDWMNEWTTQIEEVMECG